MRDYRDAKTMAQTLRGALLNKNISINHSESLEIIAKALGAKDWNTLAAAIQSEKEEPGRNTARTTHLRKRRALPVVLMRDFVVFPKSVAPIFAAREKTLRALEHAMKGDRAIMFVAQKTPGEENPDDAGVYRVGIFASVLHSIDTSDGWVLANVQSHQRVKIEQLTVSDGFYKATVAPIAEDFGNRNDIVSLAQAVHRKYDSYAQSLRPLPVLPLPVNCSTDPGHLADAIAMRLRLPVGEMQTLLEAINVPERLQMITRLLEGAETLAGIGVRE